MKKSIILFLLTFIATTTIYAQEATATLNHNNTLTTYYGVDALKSACANAQNGDVITLSHGQFNGPLINVNELTIIGNAMDADTTRGIMPTIILGQTKINTETTSFKNLCLKELYTYHNTSSATNRRNINFERCRIKSHTFTTSATTSFLLYNCIAKLGLINEIHAINSLVDLAASSCKFCKEGIYDNCVLYLRNYCYIINSTLTDCIVIDYNVNNHAFDSNVYLANTLYVGAETEPFINCFVGKAWQTGADTKIFKDDSQYYELTDEIKEKYKDTDDKELGIYGGAHTFSPNPITHHITRCDVAPKTTPDGKLSVHIWVSGAE